MIFCYIGIIFLILFAISFIREKRRFRNSIYLLCAILNMGFYLVILIIGAQNRILSIFVVVLAFCIMPIGIIVTSILFISAGIITIKREGFRIPNLLALAFGIGIWTPLILICIFEISNLKSKLFSGITFFSMIVVLYIGFTFIALLIYSYLYCILPKGKNYDYIIIHGAGLLNGERVSPLLAKRIDKGIEAFKRFDGKAKIIVSGGKGSDERISEAEAMKRYLIEKNIGEESIICEDKSTTTLENLKYSKKIMDYEKKKYKCIFVTNNYHVFRTGLFAKKINLKAEGLGCKTALYYLPSAFIREYIAIMWSMKWYSIVILGIPLLLMILAVL